MRVQSRSELNWNGCLPQAAQSGQEQKRRQIFLTFPKTVIYFKRTSRAPKTDLHQPCTDESNPRHQWRPLLESSFGLFQGARTVPVTLRFCPFRARWIRHQHWHPDQCLTEQPDGCLELTVPVSDFREIKMQIMQFGADVEVIAPEELRRESEAEIAKMNHLYRQRPPAE